MFRFLGFMTGTALAVGALVSVLGKPALQTGSPQMATDATVPPPEAIAAANSIAATAVLLAEISGPDGQVADFSIPEAAATPMTTPAGPTDETPGDPVANVATETSAATDVRPPAEPITRLSAPAKNTGDEIPTQGYAAADAETPLDDLSLTDAAPATTQAQMTQSNAQWHAFWQPFRSQVAANGFAARLQAITDLNYRVVRRMPGAYEVAFAYADDGELTAKLAQIETATGLDLPEAGP